MRWFAREQPRDIWDEAIEWPIGDIEAADRIRAICQSATASAELVGNRVGEADREKASAEPRCGRERERYERAARAAMKIALRISDDLMRDDAVRRIVDLCMKADDVETAQVLFRAIQAGWIREAMRAAYPALGS